MEAAPADPFKRFLVDLAVNPSSLAAFTSDPDGTMAEAGVSASDRAILTSGNAAAIYARFQGSAVAAVPAAVDGEQPPPDGATAARLALQLTVQPILPQVTVNPILPQVTVNPILPQVTVNPIFPQVTVNPVFPQVTVNPIFPQVTVNPIFPQVTVHPTFPQFPGHTDPLPVSPPVTVQTVLPYPQNYPYPYPYPYPPAGPWGSYPPPSQSRCCCCCRCRCCGC